MTRWVLFLDDLRFPAQERDDLVIARTSHEALALIETRGCPAEMMLDHDLGEGDDASKIFYNGFEDLVLDRKVSIPEDFRCTVHSMNPIGGPVLKAKIDRLVAEMRGRGSEGPMPLN